MLARKDRSKRYLSSNTYRHTDIHPNSNLYLLYIRIRIVNTQKINNMGFQRLLHTETGRIIISIVLGLGIASLFRKVCKDRSCISFRAPPLKDLEKDTYKLDDKCYEYKTKAVKCEAGKKEVKLSK